MSTETLIYFAYGSNMHPARLRARVPSCQAIGIAALPNHTLRFHKRGADGSAKCNVWRSTDPADTVWGVLYSLAAEHKPALDQVEGVGKGYEIDYLQLTHAGVMHEPFIYRAQPDSIDDSLSPFDWYKDFVVQGARHHGLPDHYIAQLSAVSAISDPQPARNQHHARILDSV